MPGIVTHIKSSQLPKVHNASYLHQECPIPEKGIQVFLSFSVEVAVPIQYRADWHSALLALDM